MHACDRSDKESGRSLLDRRVRSLNFKKEQTGTGGDFYNRSRQIQRKIQLVWSSGLEKILGNGEKVVVVLTR
jgi:hypothetical protein